MCQYRKWSRKGVGKLCFGPYESLAGWIIPRPQSPLVIPCLLPASSPLWADKAALGRNLIGLGTDALHNLIELR